MAIAVVILRMAHFFKASLAKYSPLAQHQLVSESAGMTFVVVCVGRRATLTGGVACWRSFCLVCRVLLPLSLLLRACTQIMF